MNVDNINKKDAIPRVILSALDWGLGHATRCIPIINKLLDNNIDVILAAEGPIEKLLQNEFPNLLILPLKGYGIKYSKKKQFFFLKIFFQAPGIFSSIIREKSWLNEMVRKYKIDAVISDNRFGFYHKDIPSVYITHQLSIQTGNSFLNKIANRIHYYFINKFDECWVPDRDNLNNLAGVLSRPLKFPKTPVKYIGILSRCKKTITKKKIPLLILISGPEPQRSIFENILLQHLIGSKQTAVLVRGLPGVFEKLHCENNKLEIHNHLPAEKLNELIQQSDYIIARSGYSTIMDLITLQQKAALVATPGQTEQEYLAGYLMEKQICYSCSQEGFSLEQTLRELKKFPFASVTDLNEMQEQIISSWINDLKINISPLL